MRSAWLYSDFDKTTDETTDEATDETTGETTSHLTRLSKNDSQVIGYSHPTKQPAEELLMKPLAIPLACQNTTAKRLVMAGHPKDGCQVVGYIQHAACRVDTTKGRQSTTQ